MNVSTRTTEGLPNECPVCGKLMSAAPGEPLDDVVCPHCGCLFLDEQQVSAEVPDALRRLADLGIYAETDDQGEVMSLRIVGISYNDAAVAQLGKLRGVPLIDIRQTAITVCGATRLRSLLPNATILHR